LVRGGSYCPLHVTSRWRVQDEHRGTPAERGYGRDWPRLARRVRLEEPFCRACTAAGRLSATELVDHVVALVDGGTHARENLQGLCRSCHATKTAEDGRRRAHVASRDGGLVAGRIGPAGGV
jgi:5-methylcytosine-specific restriction protein A